MLAQCPSGSSPTPTSFTRSTSVTLLFASAKTLSNRGIHQLARPLESVSGLGSAARREASRLSLYWQHIDRRCTAESLRLLLSDPELVAHVSRSGGIRRDTLTDAGDGRSEGARQPPKDGAQTLIIAPVGGAVSGRPDLHVVSVPPKRAAEGGNLPAELTTFVGRITELAALAARLEGSRLVTITGPPGSGKSRLALHVARTLAPRHVEGAWLVQLAPVSDPENVAETIARALGLAAEHNRTWNQILVDRLAVWDALIVIDNCEHLIAAAAQLVQLLLTRCPNLQVMATSRERMRIDGETVWPLDRLPDPDAIKLFSDRARSVAPGFQVNNELVSTICHCLDGIPLGIELTAARCGAMSLATMAERISRIRLNVRGHRSSVARHQTLRRALEWSYGLLDEDERRLFRRLALFVNGFELAAAETVCVDTGLSSDEVAELLVALVEKSIVTSQEGRYGLLETIREFATERLAEAGETQSVARAHASYYASLADMASASRATPAETSWLNRLWADRANLMAALDWAAPNDCESATSLALGLSLLWWVRGDDGAAIKALEKAMSAPSNEPVRRAAVILEAAIFEEAASDLPRARDHYADALGAAVQVGDPRLLSRSLEYAGWFLVQVGRIDEGRACLIESLQISREIGRTEGTATLLIRLGGMAAIARNDFQAAADYFEEAINLCRLSGTDRVLAVALTFCGAVADVRGDHRLAEKCIKEAIGLHRRNQERRFAWYPVDLAAALAARRSAFARALTLRAAAAGMRRRLGVETDAGWERAIAEVVRPASEALAGAPAESAAKAGLTMDFDQALSYAEQVGKAETDDRRLTQREAQVASLVAEGMSTKEIARRLFLSERTVESHLERIRNKLSVHSRSQISAWVVQKRWLPA